MNQMFASSQIRMGVVTASLGAISLGVVLGLGHKVSYPSTYVNDIIANRKNKDIPLNNTTVIVTGSTNGD